MRDQVVQIIPGLSAILRAPWPEVSSTRPTFELQPFKHFFLSEGALQLVLLENSECGQPHPRSLGLKTAEMLVLVLNKLFFYFSLSVNSNSQR